jgi:uncharacterized membrane protein
MDLYMIVLRLIHIFAGIFWVGSGFFMVFVLAPAARKMGQDGRAFMMGFGKHSRINMLMPMSSLLTTVAGLLLYYEVSDGFNADWMKSDGGIVLSIGVVAGLLAFGHGGAVTGPASGKLAKLGEEISAQGGPPTEAQLSQIQALQAKFVLHGQISVLLLVIAVVGMSAARYM